MQQRPAGISILAVLSVLGGAWRLFEGLITIMGGGILGAATDSAGVAAAVVVVGAAMAVVGVVYLCVAYGFWTVAPWAWPAGVALVLLSVALTLGQLLVGATSILAAILDVVIPGLVLYYLNQPHIRKSFGR